MSKDIIYAKTFGKVEVFMTATGISVFQGYGEEVFVPYRSIHHVHYHKENHRIQLNYGNTWISIRGNDKPIPREELDKLYSKLIEVL